MTQQDRPARPRLAAAAARLASAYGMGFVLLLLCGYYSLVTYQVQQPRGAGAGRQLARRIEARVPKGAAVLVVAGTGEEDAAFADELAGRLGAGGYVVAGRVTGPPRDAAVALRGLNAAGTKVAVVAATAQSAALPVLADLGRRFPDIGDPPVWTAESYRWPVFLNGENLLNVAGQIVIVAVLSVGMTLVIITGGIDLSVGSLIAFSAVVTAVLIRDRGGGAAASPADLFWCSAAGVLACAAAGAFSGVLVTAFRVPPFIVTLGVMQIALGLAQLWSRSESISDMPASYQWLWGGVGASLVPRAVVLMAVLYVAAHVLMSRTTLGRYVYAVGGNPEAARLSGVRVRAVLLFVYTLSGATAGLGGVLMTSQLKSGAPTYGLTYELAVIAAVVVGGTSLAGGEGRIFGTLIGVLVIAVIQNGMNLTGVRPEMQKVVLGGIILLAVLVDTAKKQGWLRLPARRRRHGDDHDAVAPPAAGAAAEPP